MNAPEIGHPRIACAVAAAGCALLAARPLVLPASARPVLVLTVIFVALLAVGAAWPVTSDAGTRPRPAWAAAVGVGAFAVGRLVGGGHRTAPPIARVVILGTLAAVAEEAFFRRFVFGALAPGGAALALGGSAVLFAAVHVTVYGFWVLPIDLAAGLVLSWQRWASGSWGVPALTHVLANLMVVF